MATQELWFGYKFYRSILTNHEKKIYDQVYEAIMNCKNMISIAGFLPDQSKKIINAVLSDNPMFFHVDSFRFSETSIACILYPIYRITEMQYRAYVSQLKNAVYAYVNQSRDQGGVALTVVQRLHDSFSRDIRYCDDGMVAHTVIGPLLNQQGVCEGIAKSVKLICDHLRIPSTVISGTALSQKLGVWESHAWNMIKVDGSWRYFDFTYDLTLNTTNPCQSIVRYDYFALSFDEISSDHRSKLIGLPNVHGSNNYFQMHNLVVWNPQDLSELIASAIRTNNKEVAFQVAESWSDFSPQTELTKAFSLKMVLSTGFSMSYSFSYNDMRRVCYVHFNAV